ncbi:MAG: alpha/beta hydrolase [Bacteroidetes bacterium]|nr:alpha/beta hydrolase [Bacteroidota bacterium]
MKKQSFCIFLFLFFLCTAIVYGQDKKESWKLMDRQLQKTSRAVRKYLPYDTILNLGESRIHLHYDLKPGKPYLLMLHGMGMNGRTNWMNQIPALSAEFNLLVPDLIYFGESTTDSNNVSPEFQARQIQKAIDALHIHDTIHVVGFSYGGLVAAVYNSMHSPKVGKIIIIDAPLRFYSVAMADSMAKVAGVESINRIITPTNKTEFRAMKKAVISAHYPIPGFMRRKVIRFVFMPTRELRERQLNYLALHEAHYQRLVYHLEDHPLLIVWGKKDGVIPVSVAYKLHVAYPLSRLLIFKNAKHDATFNESKILNRTISGFVKTGK